MRQGVATRREEHADMPNKRHLDLGLSDQDLLDMYETMVISRAVDDRTDILVRSGKIPFTVLGHGQEGAQVAAARSLVAGRDWVLPYYRDVGVVLALGMSLRELMLFEFGKPDDPNSGGRQMPKHWGHRRLRIVSQSSPVATQLPHACGLAWAMRQRREDGIVWVSFGDGVVSKGDFHEGLNFAGIHKLPVVFFCENNYYAISVPFSKQSPVPSVADRASAYGMPGVSVDGNDVFAVYEASLEATERAKRGEGPTLIEARTYRYAPHTSNDDDRRYRSAEEVKKWKALDPIPRLFAYLKEHHLLDEEGAEAIKAKAEQAVREAAQWAERAPDPDPATVGAYVYAEEVEEGGR